MTAPVQPGNSGGPVLDQNGSVVGVVVGKLDALAVASATGDIPQNVNFAINARTVTAFLAVQAIDYRETNSADRLSDADVGELAKNFTIAVRCVH